MKKRILLLVICCIIIPMGLTSCTRVAGNQLQFHYREAEPDLNGVTEIETRYGTTLQIDCQNKQYKVLGGSYELSEDHLIVEGGTAPRYTLSVKEGYESIEDNLLDLDLKTESSVIYTAGYLIDGLIYGICNVYYGTVGYLSGGGNYAEEEIAYSVYYRYDNATDELSVLYKTSGEMIVAFSHQKVLYWRDRNIYSYDIDADKEVLLCKDYSYDSGLSHQSSGLVIFNEHYALLDFKKASGTMDTYYLFLYTFEDDRFMELTASE
ncbi:MAG: hypothetical protein ACI4U2_00755 [Christensenellaceae bacterium]